MSITPDFSDNEIKTVTDTLNDYYGKPKQVELADVELRLAQKANELSTCPALYWENQGCHFLLAKLGPFQYRGQFFYRGDEQFSSEHDSFDDLRDCTVTLLHLQAGQHMQHETGTKGEKE